MKADEHTEDPSPAINESSFVFRTSHDLERDDTVLSAHERSVGEPPPTANIPEMTMCYTQNILPKRSSSQHPSLLQLQTEPRITGKNVMFVSFQNDECALSQNGSKDSIRISAPL